MTPVLTLHSVYVLSKRRSLAYFLTGYLNQSPLRMSRKARTSFAGRASALYNTWRL